MLSLHEELLYLAELHGVFDTEVPYPFPAQRGEESSAVECRPKIANQTAYIGTLAADHPEAVEWQPRRHNTLRMVIMMW